MIYTNHTYPVSEYNIFLSCLGTGRNMRFAGDFQTFLYRVQRHFILFLSNNVKQVKPILHRQKENKSNNRTISKKVLSFRNGYYTATIFRNLQMSSLTIREHGVFERHYHLWGRNRLSV